MLRPLWTLISAGIAFASISVEASYCPDLKVGDYERPSSPLASGRGENNTAPIRRSPCPALNTLANVGIIPRNGQGIPKEELKNAIMVYFNIGNDTASRQIASLPEYVSLDILSRVPLNQDGSMFRSDANTGIDPMDVNIIFVQQLLDLADSNGMIDTAAVASIRKRRAAECAEFSPHCNFGEPQKRAAFFQAALFLMGLGQGDFISVEYVQAFIVEESFPPKFMKSEKILTLDVLNAKSAQLVELAA